MAERMIDESTFDVGKRLKSLRVRAGLSLRQLAKESGAAFTTIQKIESGSISPTVGILMKIAFIAALGGVGSLLLSNQAAGTVIARRKKKGAKDAD